MTGGSSRQCAGGRVVFDIDYRPVLWGLTDRDMGENRTVAHQEVTRAVAASAAAGATSSMGTEGECRYSVDPPIPWTRFAPCGAHRGASGMQAGAAWLHRLRGTHLKDGSTTAPRRAASRWRCSTFWVPAMPSWQGFTPRLAPRRTRRAVLRASATPAAAPSS